ncbi:class III lanthipeptide [Amycolatopsis benzoatilytica]|nr:class III lanthipeptide [Amycolatopsis benzoatilytica]
MENVLDLQALEAPEALESQGLDHHCHGHSHFSLHCGDSTLSLLLCD